MATVELRSTEVTRADGETYQVPHWDVRADAAGPRVLVPAALHGNELHGSEILRQFLPVVERDLICGSCILMPFANPEAVRRRQPHIDFEPGRYYGSDRVNNVNCTWPGDPEGSDAQRLSHALFESVVGDATHLIDLHSWKRRMAATALARGGREDSMSLAEAMRLRFARHASTKPSPTGGPRTPCTLSTYFHDTDRTAIAVEFAGQYGFWPGQVDMGLRAMKNAFRHFGMLPGELEGKDEPVVWTNDAEMVHVPAPQAGVFVPDRLALADWVDEGARLGHVFAIDGLRTVEVTALVSGYLYEYTPVQEKGWEHTRPFMHPYADEGQMVAVIARH